MTKLQVALTFIAMAATTGLDYFFDYAFNLESFHFFNISSGFIAGGITAFLFTSINRGQEQ